MEALILNRFILLFCFSLISCDSSIDLQNKQSTQNSSTIEKKESHMKLEHFFELDNESFYKINFGSGDIIQNQDIVFRKVVMNQFQGIIIDAPSEVDRTAHNTLPLVGLFRLPSSDINDLRSKLTIIVSDNVTKETHSTILYKPKRPAANPDTDKEFDENSSDFTMNTDDGPTVQATISMEFFDTDLRKLLSLADNTTNYSVFVTVGEITSNVILINIINGK